MPYVKQLRGPLWGLFMPNEEGSDILLMAASYDDVSYELDKFYAYEMEVAA